MNIVIIDYGLSNLLSVKRAFAFLGINVSTCNTAEEISKADGLVLPGVGAFRDGMNGLRKLSLISAIQDKCAQGTPLLGICLGMQMLFDESTEFGIHKGLGLIPGSVEKIPERDLDGHTQNIPHVGWNKLIINEELCSDHPVLISPENGQEVYFVHSYEAKPLNNTYRIADTTYGGRKMCAIAQKDNIVGCQFHPEKSGQIGLSLIKQYCHYVALYSESVPKLV